jgi:hypothetical protein
VEVEAESSPDGTLNKDKALDHLQAIVQRLAGNSFSIKGWAVTVASGFLGFSVKDAKPAVAFIGTVPIVIFWCMDAYYLASERHFRSLYNTVLTRPPPFRGPIAAHRVTRKEFVDALETPVAAALYLTLLACCATLGLGLFAVK